MKEPFYALVIAAHPDDAEYGAAGTIGLWTAEGKRIAYAICTSGEKGTTDPSMRPQDLARTREEEQRAAARALGVEEVVFLRYPDQELEDTPAFRKQLVRLIRTYRPHVVLSSDPYRRYIWHRDHRMVGQAVLDAVFPYARDHLAYPDLIQEGLLPHKVREIWFWATEDPNHRSDVTAGFERKMTALRCHESQMRELNVSEMEQWLRERCRDMAKGTEYDLAEAFHRAIAPR